MSFSYYWQSFLDLFRYKVYFKTGFKGSTGITDCPHRKDIKIGTRGCVACSYHRSVNLYERYVVCNR